MESTHSISSYYNVFGYRWERKHKLSFYFHITKNSPSLLSVLSLQSQDWMLYYQLCYTSSKLEISEQSFKKSSLDPKYFYLMFVFWRP